MLCHNHSVSAKIASQSWYLRSCALLSRMSLQEWGRVALEGAQAVVYGLALLNQLASDAVCSRRAIYLRRSFQEEWDGGRVVVPLNCQQI